MAGDRVTENTAVVGEFLRRLADRDVAGALDLFTDDVVVEFPFAPPTLPDRHEGKAAFARFLTGALGGTRRMAFAAVRVEPLAAADRVAVVAEFRGDWELVNGRHYRNTYIVLAELRDGRIQHWREFFNPLVVQDAFAPAEH